MDFRPDPFRPLEDGLALAKIRLQTMPVQYQILADIIKGVDKEEFSQTLEKYRPEFIDGPGPHKYLDLIVWLADKVRTAAILELDKRHIGSVLDLGAGGCHWLAVCKAYGYKVTALDMDVPLYDDIAALYGIKRKIHRICRQEPLPKLRKKFDVVTALMANFDFVALDPVTRQRTYFSLDDWSFFLNDLVKNQLRFPALIHMELNPRLTNQALKPEYDSALLGWFKDQGAKLGVTGRPGDVTFELAEPKTFG